MQEVVKCIKEELEAYYSEADILAFIRLLLGHIAKRPYAFLLLEKDFSLSLDQQSELSEALERLKTYEPIQYILGETEFFGLPFYVNMHTLIPRPETEELVELVVNENSQAGLKVLDIGTGSGCIAVSLAKCMENAHVSAWDISSEALQVAKSNAENNAVKIDFEQVDVLDTFPADKKYDLIVSNPPYVLESEKQDMERNVLDHEPHSALFVPDGNALLFYERIADVALELLAPKGKLYFEINQIKGKDTVKLLESKGFANILLKKDISGRDRMVKAELR